MREIKDINLELERKICEFYNNQPSPKEIKDIENYFNLNSNYIKIILKHNDIKFKFHYSRNPGNNVDINFFNEIKTEKQAYWLGFFLADGYIDNKGHIAIELSIDDYEHVKKFKEDLKITSKVCIYDKNSTFGKQTNCRCGFVNYYVLYDLWYKWKINLNKSDTAIIPELINEELYKHLIRGYFDGNGSITIGINKTTGEFVNKGVSFCGTKEILDFIVNLSGFEWSWSKRKDNNTNNFQIATGKRREGYDFLNWMYKDCSICLDRKYDKFKQITK